MYAFNVDIFITSERNTFDGVFTLLFLFGPASASFAYCVSFFFSSASLCNIFVIMIGVLAGIGGPITTYTLRLIGSDPEDPWETLVQTAEAIEWVGRLVPSFCLGKGLFYTMNISTFELRGSGTTLSVWDESILFYEVFALLLQSFVYMLIALHIDSLGSSDTLKVVWDHFTSFLMCNFRSKYYVCATDDIVGDDDVVDEEERILSGSTDEDAIVMSQLRKVYGNGTLALNNLSLGIKPGEIFGLLGRNGKTVLINA